MKLIYFIAICVCLISCGNQEDSLKTDNQGDKKEDVKQINRKESVCVFASSEIEKYINNTIEYQEFSGSEYLEVIKSINKKLKKNCDFKGVTNDFLSYINSSKFTEDSGKLILDSNFKKAKNKLIKEAKDDYEAIKEVTKSLAEITYHEANKKMGLYSRSAMQRLSNVNGDTIELRKNVSYSFPTDFFVHEKLFNDKGFKFENAIIKGGSVINSIRKEELKINSSTDRLAFTSNLVIFIKTVQ